MAKSGSSGRNRNAQKQQKDTGERQVDQSVRDRYKQAGKPGSFGGARALQRVLKGTRAKKRSSEALQGEPAYTLHRPVRRKFPRRRVVVGGAGDQWQADLVDISQFKSDNDGARYLLCVIDVFSKYAWVRPLASKNAWSTASAFKDVLAEAGHPPLSLQTDKGREFIAAPFQKVLEERNIHFFTTENEDIKASVVERFQLTLQHMLYRHFTAFNTRKYLEALPSLVHSYNTTHHSTIGMAPASVSHRNAEEVWLKTHYRWRERKAPRLWPGDHVRISAARRTFDRGYLPSWSQEIFTVVRSLPTTPRTYALRDAAGEPVKGTFYYPELQKVEMPEFFQVEAVLKTRRARRGNKKEHLVKWKGYPASFNSWVSDRDLIKAAG